jgi:hypothetical protein
MRFDPNAVTDLRRGLLDRGLTLSTLLSDLLAGKRPADLAAVLAASPGIRPEEALRNALAQVERRRALLDSNDDRFGRCDVCALDLGATELGQMPWADRCRAHSNT